MVATMTYREIAKIVLVGLAVGLIVGLIFVCVGLERDKAQL